MSAGSDAPAQLGVAKVAYHAALVAAPAYVLQPMVLLAIFAVLLRGTDPRSAEERP